MTVSFLSELRFFLLSFVFGAFGGVYYDLFRFLRALKGQKASPEKQHLWRNFLSFAALFILDFLCVSSLGAIYCVFLYETHNGFFRFYSLASVLLGFFLYQKTVGKMIVFLLRRMAFLIRKCLSFLFYPVSSVFRKIFLPIFRYFKQKTLSFAQRCVKIRGKKNALGKLASHKKKQKKEPYGKAKRI